MLNRAGYRLHIDGKLDHASWWVGPVVWCRWWIEWGPERTPVAHHISTRAAQMLISWSELFECDRLDTTGTSPKPCLWYQMMIPEYEVSADGQSYQMQHWDRVERVLPPSPPWVSTARRRSFWTRRRAVSVLCSWRYADWKTSYRWWAFRWSTSCTHTMRSTSLDKKERFETGRKFFKISQSSMVFFRSGKTKALFNSGEKSANSREVLTTSVRTGVSSSRQSLKLSLITPNMSVYHWHNEAKTKRTPFCRRHIEMHFLEWKFIDFG